MTGTCKFCGKVLELGEDCARPDEMAYLHCDCTGARAERFVVGQIEEAGQNIEALFGEGCEDFALHL